MALSVGGLGLKLSLLLELCTIFAAHRFWIWYRLSHVPGPLSASLWKGWMLRHTLSGRMNLELKKVCDQYGELPAPFEAAANGTGSLARVGPNELVTCDPDILRRVWVVRSQYRRGAFFEAVKLDPTRDNLISLRDDAAHAELKAKMAMGVSQSQDYGTSTNVYSTQEKKTTTSNSESTIKLPA
jgi:hypothetical protein